jgi:2-amino-4-hydroxy-6-hydroxymethyldihydropteridine diphosphokinase
MHRVLLSLASNSSQEEHLRQARQALVQMLDNCGFTKEIWTEAMGNAHGTYLNQLAEAETDMGVEELTLRLKQLEADMGRTPEMKALGVVPIDLDLLQYDTCRYHLHDWDRPYVKRLLTSHIFYLTSKRQELN